VIIWLFTLFFFLFSLAHAGFYSKQLFSADYDLIQKSNLSTFLKLSENNNVLLKDNSAKTFVLSAFNVCFSNNDDISFKTITNKKYVFDLISCGNESALHALIVLDKNRLQVLDIHLLQTNSKLLSGANYLKINTRFNYIFALDGLLNSDKRDLKTDLIKSNIITNFHAGDRSIFLISDLNLTEGAGLLKSVLRKASHSVLEKFASDYAERATDNNYTLDRKSALQNYLKFDSFNFSIDLVFDENGISLRD